MTNDFDRQLGNLRRLIAHNFDQAAIGRICTPMGIEFERLPGETKLQKLNSLLKRCARDDQLAELVNLLTQNKPHVEWPPVPEAQPSSGMQLNSENGTGELKSTSRRYLDDIKQKLLAADLHGKSPGDETLRLAGVLVRAGFSHLDGVSKRSLLEFLHNESLIERSNPIIILDKIDLAHADLSWISLSNSLIRNINLTGADLSLANLGGVDLSGSTMRGVRLKAFLVGAVLVKSDLREADLSGALLAQASLVGANLRFADLRGADLRGADLTGADLRHANFQETDLSGANLSFSTLGQVNLKGAIMKGAILSHTDFRGLQVPQTT